MNVFYDLYLLSINLQLFNPKHLTIIKIYGTIQTKSCKIQLIYQDNSITKGE